ncbi:MAG: AtpZ/AtpI family protein [Desulfuromonadaceae bacterium]|nr:AtpZ/AtpI family protein [Desulfuromonadaceae bacterium]
MTTKKEMTTDGEKKHTRSTASDVDEATERNANEHSTTKHSSYGEAVGTRARRKEKARANPARPLWSGFSLFGIVGWSVSVPTLFGITLGVWLDRNYAAPHSWTLTLLTVGLVLGCFNAWRWISHEERNIHNNDDPAEEDQHGE